jgi:hypothetical protein
MKRMKIPGAIAAVFLFLSLTCTIAHADGEVEQKFTLKPGWNAVFLDVQPEDNAPATVFDGLPEESSVWAWIPLNTKVEFIQNPDEELWNQPGWAVYFKSTEKQILNNLHAVFAGWSYLIYLAGDQNFDWNVTGVPSVRKIKWTTDSFNLVGLHVEHDKITFADFFSPSPAHTGQYIYKLDNEAGKWEFIEDPAEININSGEAYWIYCEGASDYQGPLDVELPMYDGFNFGAYSDSLTVALHNLSDRTLTVSLAPLSTAVDLAYRWYNRATIKFEWLPLQDMPPFDLEPDGWKNIRIAVRRESLKDERAGSVIEINDGFGTRLPAPVYVEKEVTQ